MNSELVNITPEVSMDSQISYLIRIDGQEMAFAKTEEEARLIIDSIANAETKRMTDEVTEIFRNDSKDENRVVLSRKDLGVLYNSSVYKVMEVDYIPVGHALLTRSRHELPAKIPIPPPPPLPQPRKLLKEKLEKIRAEVQGLALDCKTKIGDSDDDTEEDSDYDDTEALDSSDEE